MQWIARVCMIAVVAASSVPACKRAPKCHGELTRDELYRLQELAQDGSEPCPDLRSPVIELSTASGLQLGGQQLVSYAELPREPNKKVDLLWSDLRTRRETWKQVHPAKSFDADPTLRVSPNVDTSTAASVMKTTAFAGYPKMRVESGGVSLVLGWNVPGPPTDDAPPPVVLRVVQTQQGSYAMRFAASPAHEVAQVDAIPEWIASQCAAKNGRCADVVQLDVRGPFIGTIALLRDILRIPALAQRPPWVVLGALDP